MVVQERKLRQKIYTRGQHPLRHTLADFAYSNPNMPGVTSPEGALNYLIAVLYPQSKDAVDTPGDLPAVGNTINDYRVVIDDGDGKAAGYRWFAFEGEAASWKKIYDMDWGVDSVLTGFYAKTQDLYVSRLGYDNLDASGAPVVGLLAGQSVYGGKTANSHLTFYANVGDGMGAPTGFVQFGDNVRPVFDDAFDLGTDDERWSKVWAQALQAGTLSLGSGSIVDSTDAIDFGNGTLTTTGQVVGAVFLADDGTQNSPGFSFQGDPNSGWYLAGLGEISLSLQDNTVAQFNADGLNLASGDASSPSLRFSGNAGLYAETDDILIGSNGNQVARFATSGDVSLGAPFYFDVDGGGFFGIGTVTPSAQLHIYAEDAQSGAVYETRSSTATEAPTLRFVKTRSSNANLQALDTMGRLDFRGKANAAVHQMATMEAIYRGNSTTRFADLAWSVANGAGVIEKMRLRYDGNLGLGVSDPTHTLHVIGDFQIDSLLLDGTTISVQSVNGDLNLQANGTGSIYASASLIPTDDGNLDLGSSTLGAWGMAYLEDGISDGTNTITMGTLLSFRQALIGATAGMSLFYDGSVWLASLADSEVDHGTIAGLTDDDHTQYALLAGRSGGQTLNGGTGSGDDLYLVSTSHGTKGNVFFTGHLAPTSPDTYDIGGSGAEFRNFYLSGQAIGLRVENYATGGRPSATVGTAGRLYYDTTTTRLNYNRAGTWADVPEKVKVVDTTSYDGLATVVNHDVSGLCADARDMIWCIKKNADDFLQETADIRATSATNVRVTVGIPLAAGTYTLLGVG